MQINDPLRIFTKSEIDKLSHDTLLRYRKEKLLLFQMTEKYTVKLNGHEVDKNTVMSIFSELENSLDNHLFQYQVPEIQEFLSCPDLSKFNLIQKIDFGSMSDSVKGSVIDNIISKINNSLGRDIINRKIGPINIKKMVDFTELHLGDTTSESYSKVYTELNNYVNDLTVTYEQPFEEKHLNSTKVYPEIEKILKSKFYECLAALPNQFEPIKMSFAMWCNTNVLQNAFDRTTEFNRFKKSTLSAFREAMYIAANYYHTKHHRDNARMVTSYLTSSGNSRSNSTGGSSGCGGIGIVLGIILFVIKFGILFNKCSNDSYNSGYGNSSRYGNNRSSQSSRETSDMIKEMIARSEREAASKRKSSSSNYTTNSSKSSSSKPQIEEDKPKATFDGIYPRGGSSVQTAKVVKDYAGENKLSINAKVRRIEHKEDYVEVYFDCDALPMYHQSYSAMIPEELKNKYAGKVLDAVFIFEPNGLREAATHVSLKIDLKRKSKYPATSFGFVKKVTEQELKLHVRKIKTADFAFKGYVQKYKLGETKSRNKTRFKIKYDKAKKGYRYSESGKSYQPIDLSAIKEANVNTLNQRDQGDIRYAALVNNIKIIQDKYLRQASLYTIPKSTYVINAKYDINRKMYLNDGILKLYITSIGDNNTYVQLKMDKSLVNYIVNKEGYITTVQQVTYDRSNKTIERILMTR